jgi:aminopeptidase N
MRGLLVPGRAGARLRWLALPLAWTIGAALLVVGPSTPSAALSSTGAASAGDRLFPAIGNGGYDVRHYRIAFGFAKQRIKGSTTIAAKANQRLTSFSLDFKGLTVTGVTVNGRKAAWKRSRSKLVVTPSAAIAKARTFTTKVAYSGKPVSITDPDGSKEGWIATKDGATALGEPIGAMTWFPNNNTPRDKATYDLLVTVPKQLEVASNGDLMTRERKGARTTWHWRQRTPMTTALAMVSIGDYRVHTGRISTSTGRKLPVWSFVGSGLGSLATQRALLPKAIRFTEKFLGAYPQTSSGMVAKKLGIGYSLETQNRPFFSSVPDTATIVHEVAHQWFGDSVSVRRWEDIWLNEGFATLMEWCWAADHGGRSVPDRYRAILAKHPASDKGFWSPAPAKLPNASYLFDDAVYTRGALALWALREKLGAEVFWKLVRTWVSTHRGGTATTADFAALAEKVSGKKLDGFFTAWLYTAKRP